MKRFVICLLLAAAVMLLILFLMPDLRRSMIGTRLRHNIELGWVDQVSSVSLVLLGNEIRQLSSPENPLPSPETHPDMYDVRFTTTESVSTSGKEKVLNYEVTSAKAEQIGRTGISEVLGNAYKVRLLPRGLIASCTLEKGKPSRILSDVYFSQIFASIWPCFPNGRVSEKESWDGRWDIKVKMGVLDDKIINLQQRINYTLDSIRSKDGVTVAKIDYTGEILPKDSGDLPEGVKVIGTGKIQGTSYVNLDTGITLLCDENLFWSVVARMDDEMETVSFLDRKTRTFRPRMIPNGDAGFDKTLDSFQGNIPSLIELDKVEKEAKAKEKAKEKAKANAKNEIKEVKTESVKK